MQSEHRAYMDKGSHIFITGIFPKFFMVESKTNEKLSDTFRYYA